MSQTKIGTVVDESELENAIGTAAEIAALMQDPRLASWDFDARPQEDGRLLVTVPSWACPESLRVPAELPPWLRLEDL